jgi:hypothetical protein
MKTTFLRTKYFPTILSVKIQQEKRAGIIGNEGQDLQEFAVI